MQRIKPPWTFRLSGLPSLAQRYGAEICLGIILLAYFMLQAGTLRWSSNPIYDEGVHADAGRMIFEGFLPYRDFSYPHPPLLPLFIGGGLKVFGSMNAVRMVYLLLNVLSILPLYAILVKIGKNRFAALFAVLFYLTYIEMVHHDFRIVATRPFNNLFFIGFLYWGLVKPYRRWSGLWQGLCALLAAFSFLPSMANLGITSFMIIFLEKDRRRRRTLLKRFVLIGCLVGAALGAFFLAVPGSLQQTVLEHLRIVPMSPKARTIWTIGASRKDLFFYSASLWALLIAIMQKRSRVVALAMLLMILTVFLPNEFYPHYFVVIAVPLTIGILFLMVFLFSSLADRPFLATVLAGLLLSLHLSLTLPPLLTEWTGHTNPGYEPVPAFLAQTPEPMLTFMEPIYAVDAHRTVVHHYYRAASRFGQLTGHLFSSEEFLRLGTLACTIVLPPWDQDFVPKAIQEQWKSMYTEVSYKPWLKVYLTNNPGCHPFTPPNIIGTT